MWSNRWVRVGSVAAGFLLIVAVCNFISFLMAPGDDEIPLGPVEDDSTAQTVLAVAGVLAVVALLAGAAAWWSVRYPAGRVAADLGIATAAGALLALILAPLAGGEAPFEGGLEAFVLNFLQFLGWGALGILLGFAAVTVAGKDYRSRGLAAFAERHGKRLPTATKRR